MSSFLLMHFAEYGIFGSFLITCNYFQIPVYLAKNLENKLYVVCYPTHPMRDGSDNFTVLKSSFKPENQEFCFEITVDTENSTYDRSKGVQLALNAKKESKRNEAAYDR